MIDWQDLEMSVYQYECKTFVLKNFGPEWEENGDEITDQVYAELFRWA